MSRTLVRVSVSVFWITYALLPLATGAWHYDRIDCVRVPAFALKEGLSLLAYCALPVCIYRSRMERAGKPDAPLILLLSSLALGIAAAGNVIQKCW